MKGNRRLTDKEMDMFFRHFDRSEVPNICGRKIFGNARFNFSKDFSTTLEMMTNLRINSSKYLIFTINY